MTYKFNSLQCFRGLAALGVVLHHTAQSTHDIVATIPSKLNSILHFGFLGVDLFFVLSGFIILTSHFNDKKTIQSLKVYCSKRLFRIFPPYWPVSIALIFAYTLLPSMSQGVRGEFSFLSSLLLLPDTPPPALSVAWTLIHEMMFYILFMIFFYSNRLFLSIVIVWMLSMLLTLFITDEFVVGPVLNRLLNPINIEFIMGMGVALLARVMSYRLGGTLIIVSLILFILLLQWPSSLEYRFVYGIPFSLLVLGSSLLERQYKFSSPNWLVKMGDASYSIYLIHNPLVSLTSRLASRLNGYSTWWLGMLLGVFSSLIIGYLYHLWVEKPLVKLFRKYLLHKKSI